MQPTPSSLSTRLALVANPLKGMKLAHQRHGDAVVHDLGLSQIVQLTHPAGIEALLKTRSNRKSKVVRGLAGVLGDGLLTSEGERYAAQKKQTGRLFTPRHIDGWAAKMDALAQAGIASMSEGTRDVLRPMNALALDLITATVFGVVGGREIASVMDALEFLLDDYWRHTHTWRRLVPTFPGVPRQRAEASQVLTEAVDTLARKDRDSTTDFLSQLLDAGFEGEGLYELVIPLLVAGHETTALLVSYTVHHLARNPMAARRVAEEFAEGGPRAMADVRRYPLATAALRESMRLHPPAFSVARELTEPLEVGGVLLKRGQQVICPQWVVHQDPRWWPEPHRFDMNRFLIDSDRPKFAYFPFGGGNRVCIGSHFAMLEATILLGHLLRRFTLSDAEPLSLKPAVTLRPEGGVRVRLTARTGLGSSQQAA